MPSVSKPVVRIWFVKHASRDLITSSTHLCEYIEEILMLIFLNCMKYWYFSKLIVAHRTLIQTNRQSILKIIFQAYYLATSIRLSTNDFSTAFGIIFYLVVFLVVYITSHLLKLNYQKTYKVKLAYAQSNWSINLSCLEFIIIYLF